MGVLQPTGVWVLWVGRCGGQPAVVSEQARQGLLPRCSSWRGCLISFLFFLSTL